MYPYVGYFQRRLSGGAIRGGTDSISLKHWMLVFGEAIIKLGKIVAEFSE